MSNPRKVVDLSTRKISRAEKINRKRQEQELKIDREGIEGDGGAPDWLDDVARKEFERVVHEAGKIPMLDNLDRSVLAIYASNYSKFVDAEKNLQKYGPVVKANGMPMPSPYVNVSDKAAAKVLQCSSKLGLAVTDRLKLIVPTKEATSSPVEKWLKFLPPKRGGRAAMNDA